MIAYVTVGADDLASAKPWTLLHESVITHVIAMIRCEYNHGFVTQPKRLQM